MGRRIWSGGGKAPDLNRPVIACCCKVLVGWIESETFDMTLVADQCLELLKCMPRPDHDFGIQPYGH